MISSPNLQRDRACDQCWSRKVKKCDRSDPCTRCSRLSLECSFIRPRKKKGPSGKIGLMRLFKASNLSEEIVEFKGTPLASRDSSSGLPASCLPSNADIPSIPSEDSTIANEMLFDEELFSDFLMDIPTNLESALFSDVYYLSNYSVKFDSATIYSLVNSYAWRMSKHYPLVDSVSLLARLGANDYIHNRDFRALVHSICAFVLLMPIFKRDDTLRDTQAFRERTQLVKILMNDAIAIRNMGPSNLENPSVDIVLTSFFLFKCLENLHLLRAAWFRLREAVSLAEILAVQSPGYDETSTVVEQGKRTILYRILAVTEHAHAIEQRYSLSRHTPSRLDLSTFSTLPQSDLGAFSVMKLISLFGVVSVDMLECWNGKCTANSPAGCGKFSVERALKMHQLISAVYDDNNIDDNLLSDDQIADITITQQWLHNRVWNICCSHGLLKEEDSPDGCREMSISYAIDIARDTIRICKMFTMENLEVHGFGITLKLYEIASSLVMMISRWPSSKKSRVEELMPSDVEILNQFIALFAAFAGGQHDYLVPLMRAVVGLPSLHVT
ncbi:hypothetical protein V1509DRAFT_565564 [Lipomyces kononenkoae]